MFCLAFLITTGHLTTQQLGPHRCSHKVFLTRCVQHPSCTCSDAGASLLASPRAPPRAWHRAAALASASGFDLVPVAALRSGGRSARLGAAFGGERPFAGRLGLRNDCAAAALLRRPRLALCHAGRPYFVGRPSSGRFWHALRRAPLLGADYGAACSVGSCPAGLWWPMSPVCAIS